jgi:hypothetical protein
MSIMINPVSSGRIDSWASDADAFGYEPSIVAIDKRGFAPHRVFQEAFQNAC